MKYLLFVFSLCFWACSGDTEKPFKKATLKHELILGERIDGPAKMRDTVNGKALFILNDNVNVQTSVTENKWLVAGLDIKLNKQQLNDLCIWPGVDIIDTKGKVVGKTLDTLPVWLGNEEEKEGFIGAYTHINNIKPGTVPENVLSRLLKNDKLTLDDLQPFIADFVFEKEESMGIPDFLTFYFIYESIVEDMSPRDRITLLFSKKDNTLVGIIHSRNLQTGKYKTYDLVRGHKLTVTANIPQQQVEQIIKMRTKFYSSAD